MNITSETSIGEIVKANFRTVQVLEKYNLDFCCGGKKIFTSVCKEKGLNPEEISKEISKIESEYTSEKFNLWSPGFLCDYIVANHHNYIKNSLPVISAHIEKVKNAHGEKYPEIQKIQDTFSKMSDELVTHMEKEEKILFPYIKNLQQIPRANACPPFGKVETPISVLIREHEQSGEEIELLREFSNDFTPPPNACTTFKITYQELEEFYKDLKIHIHLENNILFPKAIEQEANTRNTNFDI